MGVLGVIIGNVWVAENPYVHALLSGLMEALVLFVLMRFGLVALAVGFYFADLLNETPITADLSAWYAGSGLLVMLVLAGSAVYGFSISLAGRPLLRDLFFQDE